MKIKLMQFPVLFLLLFALVSVAEYKNSLDIKSNKILESTIDEKVKKLNRYTFANETLPFYLPEVRKSFRTQLKHVAQTGWHSHYLLKESYKLFPAIEKILHENGVPSDMKYIAVCESALDNSSVSSQKAGGLWQMMKQTAIEQGLEVNNEVDERYNIEKSTIAACKLLKKDRDFFGSWSEAAVAYNMGSVALYKSQRMQKTKEIHELVLNKETRNYITRALAYKEFMENAPFYGQPFPKKLVFAYDTIEITKSIPDLKSFCTKKRWNFETIKKDNQWILGNQLTIKKTNQHYKILVRKY
ncbi:MAG: lytic transglycosylase domain-containing protein [Cytophagales bacterium]